MSSTSSPATRNKGDDTRPLPLSELKRWMSEDVFLWIKEGDEKQQQLDKELEENAYMNASNLFGEAESDSEEEENRRRRVLHWSSSTTSPDGVGGFQQRKSTSSSSVVRDCYKVPGNGDGDDGGIKIVFILSDSYEGFGDILWSSARYVANTISNPITCRELLSPLLLSSQGNDDNDLDNLSSQQHPLQGTSFLEVGAGAGVPSWAAMKCGANVVCTDLKDTNRIRSMAECAERNFRQIGDDNDSLLANAKKTRVCPHDWGSPTDGVVKALNNNDSGCNDNDNDNEKEQRLFDVIIAADCCYMPWWHKELLDSIHKLLSDRGVAIISFALHGNTDDDDVWKLVDRAKDRGFVVEVLESQQLSPPSAAMESKQGLVHTVRLTKPMTM